MAGRDLTADDGPTSEPVVLVNETLARTIWPGQDPIGQYLKSDGLGARFERRVVGVVADVRHRALEDTAGLEMYLPIRQNGSYNAFYLVVRSSQPTRRAGAGAARVARAVRRRHGRQPAPRPRDAGRQRHLAAPLHDH